MISYSYFNLLMKLFKIFIVTFLMFFGCMQISFAFNQKVVDSLKLRLNSDDKRVLLSANFGLHREYWNYDNSKSLFYGHIALDIAYILNNKSSISSIYGDLCFNEYIAGNFKKAIAASDSSIRILKEIGDSVTLSYNLSTRGYVLVSLGYNVEAYNSTMMSFNYLNTNSSSVGYNYADLAKVLLSSYDYPKAEQCLKQAVDLFTDLGPTGDLAYTFSIKASLLTQQGKVEEAINYYKEAILNSTETGDRIQTFEDEIALATLYVKHDFNKAKVYFNKFESYNLNKIGLYHKYYIFLIKYYLQTKQASFVKTSLDKLEFLLKDLGEIELLDYFYLKAEYYNLIEDYQQSSNQLYIYHNKFKEQSANLSEKKKEKVNELFFYNDLNREYLSTLLQKKLAVGYYYDLKNDVNSYILYLYISLFLLVILLVFIVRYRIKIFNVRRSLKLEQSLSVILNKNIDAYSQKLGMLNSQNQQLFLLAFIAKYTNKIIIIANSKGEIEWVNNSLQTITGFSFAELSKKYGRTIFQTSNIKTIDKIKESIASQKSISFESEIFVKTGKSVDVQIVISPFYDNDGVLEKIIMIQTKISETAIAIDNQKLRIESHLNEITKQKDRIKKQSMLITGQVSKIVANIELARQIQKAILPKDETLKKLFPKHFIYYKAKDILSGDFYWSFENDDSKFLLVGDCTGHGVPGAFMSILGMMFLSKIVYEHNIVKCNEILNELKRMVIHALNQTGEVGEASDGMDISLCVIDKKTNVLNYSGANNPIYIVNNNELELLAPDKVPIGIHRGEFNGYSTKSYQLMKNTRVYMFSDGYPDQFGGIKGKKFKYNNFKELLVKSYNGDMEMQAKVINDIYNMWKGSNEQVDDVVIIGFEV